MDDATCDTNAKSAVDDLLEAPASSVAESLPVANQRGTFVPRRQAGGDGSKVVYDFVPQHEVGLHKLINGSLRTVRSSDDLSGPPQIAEGRRL
jgi:hypothetical protein